MFSIKEYGVEVVLNGGRTFLVWTGANLETARKVAAAYTTAQILIRYAEYSEWATYYA